MNLWERITKIGNGAKILRDWLGAGGVAVDRTLAQSRANICLKCPMNQPGNAVVSEVANAIKEHIQFKNEMGLRVLGEKSLLQCQVCLCALRLKVWCPIEHVTAHTDRDELDNYPPECWIKKGL